LLRRFALPIVVFALSAVAAPAGAAPCDELRALPIANIEVDTAEIVAPGTFVPPNAGGNTAAAAPYRSLPSFCRVAATLKPTPDSDIKVEVWLPVGTWNGKFQGVGNGGWAGVIPYGSLGGAVAAGYANAGTDAGHNGNTAAFAIGHPGKVVDMGYRAVHEMTVYAKNLVAAYYGSAPSLSVWNACSTGGRQGITAAVRFPTDFDAVVAGAPAVDWMHLHAGRLALHQAVNRSATHRVPPEKYGLIHQAVLNACDGLDGVKDGVLEDPRACRFDPEVLACTGPDGPTCLTQSQVEAARAFYEPVRHPATGEIIMAGLERGTELSWDTLGGDQPIGNAVEAFKYVVFKNKDWDWRRFNLATDLTHADAIDGGVLASTDADLRPFFERGGKLLMYHGWNDPQIPPRNTVALLNRIVEKAGAAAVGRSVQLFMVPGMNHCRGGVGTDRFRAVEAVEEWMMTGTAPSRLTASRVTDGRVDRTRPLCAFGTTARWNGVGNSDEAGSFVCAPEGDVTQSR
jgi:Tannase and feruloyl esterase